MALHDAMMANRLKITGIASRAILKMTCPQDLNKNLILQCENKDYEGFVFSAAGIVCNLQEKADILASWILLDSQLTVDVFCN